MLSPKKLNYKKLKKVRVYGIETKVNNPAYGLFAIKSVSSGRITSQQIECIRKLISRKMQKSGFLQLKIFPHTPVTSKPIEVRMGKGKGSFHYWCFGVKPGRILFEFHGISFSTAIQINKLVNSKLPFMTKLITFL